MHPLRRKVLLHTKGDSAANRVTALNVPSLSTQFVYVWYEICAICSAVNGKGCAEIMLHIGVRNA